MRRGVSLTNQLLPQLSALLWISSPVQSHPGFPPYITGQIHYLLRKDLPPSHCPKILHSCVFVCLAFAQNFSCPPSWQVDMGISQLDQQWMSRGLSCSGEPLYIQRALTKPSSLMFPVHTHKIPCLDVFAHGVLFTINDPSLSI